jgi:hypothetical protein
MLLAGGRPIPSFFAPLPSTVQRYTRSISAQEGGRPVPTQNLRDFRVASAILEFVLVDAFEQQRAGREVSPALALIFNCSCLAGTTQNRYATSSCLHQFLRFIGSEFWFSQFAPYRRFPGIRTFHHSHRLRCVQRAVDYRVRLIRRLPVRSAVLASEIVMIKNEILR